MQLSGVAIDDRQVLQIAGLVERTLGSKLVTAYRLRWPVVALTVGQREQILDALKDASPALRELRDRLLANDVWRMRQRL